MEQLTIEQLINETFGEDKEVHGVAMYILSMIKVNQSVTQGLATNSNDLKNLTPQELALAIQYNDGLTDNEFFHKYFAPIKSHISLSNIKHRSMGYMIGYHMTKNKTPGYVEHAKAITLTYIDTFTLLAFLWKGGEFANEFDIKLRSVYGLSPEQEKYFNSI